MNNQCSSDNFSAIAFHPAPPSCTAKMTSYINRILRYRNMQLLIILRCCSLSLIIRNYRYPTQPTLISARAKYNNLQKFTRKETLLTGNRKIDLEEQISHRPDRTNVTLYSVLKNSCVSRSFEGLEIRSCKTNICGGAEWLVTLNAGHCTRITFILYYPIVYYFYMAWVWYTDIYIYSKAIYMRSRNARVIIITGVHTLSHTLAIV